MERRFIFTAAIVGVIARFGFDCRFEIVKEDGSIEEILGEERAIEEVAEVEKETSEENKETPEE